MFKYVYSFFLVFLSIAKILEMKDEKETTPRPQAITIEEVMRCKGNNEFSRFTLFVYFSYAFSKEDCFWTIDLL